ncbi:cache domain-containing protein [Ponticoccus sp. (in: a-proteobacteria)]|uniref:cache domain-containing protein n=1 Tax=Ponticoccus sp. (in: a-proteobacteria) TaxID=1925025 RepID=UPI003AB56D07
MRRAQKNPSPRAITWIATALLLSVLCAALFVAFIVTQRSTLAQQHLRHDVVLRGADAVALSFNTALKREWGSLHAVAGNISNASKSETNDFMDAVPQAGGQVAWAGVADLDGRILSGSGRAREGEDVSQRRWYREGLRHPSVGNVYASNSLQQSLLNLSTPVRDKDSGEVTGVLVYSLRMDWVENFLTLAREQLKIDVVVQNREGETLVDTRDVARSLPEAAVAQARLGRDLAGNFYLLDQTDGIYAFSPNFISDDLPDFGWRVFAVLDSSSLINVMPQLLRTSVLAVSLAAGFVLIVTLIAARIVLRPIEDLVGTAAAMAEGEFSYPRESRSSREAITLSQALTRIQGTLALLQKRKAGRDTPSLRDGGEGGDGPRPNEGDAPDHPQDATWQPRQTSGQK